MRPLSCFAPPETPFKIKVVVEGFCLYQDNSHPQNFSKVGSNPAYGTD